MLNRTYRTEMAGMPVASRARVQSAISFWGFVAVPCDTHKLAQHTAKNPHRRPPEASM